MTLLRRRLIALMVAWTIAVGINEALFYTSLISGQGLGTGGVDYALVFSRERSFRVRMNEPCPISNGRPCTAEQVATWQRDIQQQVESYQNYHRQFREDVLDRSRSFLLWAALLLVLGCSFILLLEFRHHRTNITHGVYE